MKIIKHKSHPFAASQSHFPMRRPPRGSMKGNRSPSIPVDSHGVNQRGTTLGSIGSPWDPLTTTLWITHLVFFSSKDYFSTWECCSATQRRRRRRRRGRRHWWRRVEAFILRVQVRFIYFIYFLQPTVLKCSLDRKQRKGKHLHRLNHSLKFSLLQLKHESTSIKA